MLITCSWWILPYEGGGGLYIGSGGRLYIGGGGGGLCIWGYCPAWPVGCPICSHGRKYRNLPFLNLDRILQISHTGQGFGIFFSEIKNGTVKSFHK